MMSRSFVNIRYKVVKNMAKMKQQNST